MKKNYSQKFFKPTIIVNTPIKNNSVQKHKPAQSPSKKPFTRKPAATYIPLTRKKGGQSVNQIDSTMEQTNFSSMLQKSKTLKFVSSRSQASLNNSNISKSSASLSFVNSKGGEVEQQHEISAFLPSESFSPMKQNSQRELFRRKTSTISRTHVLNKKRNNQSIQNENIQSNTTMSKNYKCDYSQQQTKLQSSQFSDLSKSFCSPPSGIKMTKNIVQNSKNSSKQSMRKSNSSNSLIKKQVVKPCQDCQFHQKQLRQLNSQKQRLQRIIKNKDDQINNLNTKINGLEKKNRDAQRKLKDFEKFDYPSKLSMLEQQLIEAQNECTRMKEDYSKSMQQLKYKNVQNTTLKKYQAQCQGLERKCQMLVSQRNQLRQKIANVQISSKSSYINYPSPSSRFSKNVNLVVKPPQYQSSNRTTLTSRDKEEYLEDQQQTLSTTGVFKKKNNHNNCYDSSEESQIISLSEQSNF